MVKSSPSDKGEYGFRHCVVASTWAFEAQGPGSIPGGGAKAKPEQSYASGGANPHKTEVRN
jgi:hypothetical protein